MVLLPTNAAQELAFVVLVEADAVEGLDPLTCLEYFEHTIVDILWESPLGFGKPLCIGGRGPLGTNRGEVALYICFEQLKLVRIVRLVFRIRNKRAAEFTQVAAPIVLT